MKIESGRTIKSRIIDPSLSVAYSECSGIDRGITSKPGTFQGKPCIAETRIPVAIVLRYLATNEDPIEDLGITQEDIDACLSFAARVCDYPIVALD